MEKENKTNIIGRIGAALFTVSCVLFLALPAGAQTATPTATDIATGTGTAQRDQFLPAMVAAIPLLLTVVVAKRVFRWVKGNG